MPTPSKSSGVESLVAKGIQPRGLSLAEAAAYVGLGAAEFEREVEAGKFPPPINRTGARRIWDRLALDAALDGQQQIRRTADDDEVMQLIDGAA